MGDAAKHPGSERAGEEPSPEARFLALGAELADGVLDALPGWVERSVARVAEAWRPGLAASLAQTSAIAGRDAADEIGEDLRALLALDADAQPTGPLDVIRRSVSHPTRVLAEAGVPPVVRDEYAERAHPGDAYDLTPGSFADLAPELGELGIRWGAAKAFVVLRRRRGSA